MGQLTTKHNQATLETLLGNAKSLPIEYVIYIFGKFEKRYLTLWVDKVASLSVSIEELAQSWAEDLSDLSVDELKRGLEASKASKYPPEVYDFREFCRPSKKPEEALINAQMYQPYVPKPIVENQENQEKINKLIEELKAKFTEKTND